MPRSRMQTVDAPATTTRARRFYQSGIDGGVRRPSEKNRAHKKEADPPRDLPRGQPHAAGRTAGASRPKGQACEGSGRPGAPPPLIRPPVAHRAPWTAPPTVAGVAGGRPPLNRVAPALEFAVGRRLARATCGGRLTPGGRAAGPRVSAIIFANRFPLTVRRGERARGRAPRSRHRGRPRAAAPLFLVGSASTRTGTSGGRGRVIHTHHGQ